MAFDEELALRMREHLDGEPGYDEKRMFGGLAIMIDGNMAAGVIGDDMIVRVGPDAYADSLKKPGARIFDFTGKPMKGWVIVGSDALVDEDAFAMWLSAGLAYARSFPPK